ncbi:hypothetical protein D3C72_1976270 [compost metagenome]
MLERPFDGDLHKIVGIFMVARDCPAKAPQPWQQGGNFGVERCGVWRHWSLVNDGVRDFSPSPNHLGLI